MFSISFHQIYIEFDIFTSCVIELIVASYIWWFGRQNLQYGVAFKTNKYTIIQLIQYRAWGNIEFNINSMKTDWKHQNFPIKIWTQYRCRVLWAIIKFRQHLFNLNTCLLPQKNWSFILIARPINPIKSCIHTIQLEKGFYMQLSFQKLL